MARSYRELDVWMHSRQMVRDVYELTKSFPREEQFGLTSQLRRAAVSVPSNIAEGCGRNHYKDSIQFFFHARGSLYEIETQILLSADLGFTNDKSAESILNKVESCKRLLNGFINYFERRANESNVNDPLSDYITGSSDNT
jgi:four helix bundle protein